MRVRLVPVILTGTLALGLSACSDPIPAPDLDTAPPPAATQTVTTDTPTAAQQALTHVPADVASVTVTDFDRVALQLGVTDYTSDLSAKERASFWTRAAEETVLLTPGILRPSESRLLSDFSFGQEDMAWEAHLFDDAGTEVGWIIQPHPLIDPAAIQKAVKAGVGPLGDAEVDPETGLVTSGVAIDADTSETWADQPIGRLVVGQADSTYAEQGCVDAPPEATGLDELSAYVVSFGGSLATAWLGEDRGDLFERIRFAAGDPGFASSFDGGVADPRSGRIGYRLTDIPGATSLTLRRRLPFAACGS